MVRICSSALCAFALWVAGLSMPLSAEVQRDPLIDRDADAALARLFAENTEAELLAKDARAVLIFPQVVRTGFVLGAESGYGVLRVGEQVDGYYRTLSISLGAQTGMQAYGYVILFMTEEALDAFKSSEKYEIGADSSIAVARAGATADTEPSRMKTDTYGFIFGETGLMIAATLKFATITKSDR